MNQSINQMHLSLQSKHVKELLIQQNKWFTEQSLKVFFFEVFVIFHKILRA